MAKKAASAYFLWLGEQRNSIVEQYDLKGKKGSEVSKKAGEVWKAMAPADKKKWEDMAAKDKARYEEEVKTLGKRERAPKKDKDAPAGKRAKKDKNAPKKPLTPYFAWLAENRQAIVDKYQIDKTKIVEVTRKAAEEWKNLAAEAKKPYEEKFEAAKAEYSKEHAAYMASRPAVSGGAEKEEEEEEQEGEGDSEAKAAKGAKAAKVAKVAKAAKAKPARAKVSPKEAKAAKPARAKAAPKRAAGAKAKAKAKAKAAQQAEETLDIPKAVLDKADKAGMADTLRRLLARDDVQAQSVKAKDALAALEEAGGLMHKARRAMLGA